MLFIHVSENTPAKKTNFYLCKSIKICAQGKIYLIDLRGIVFKNARGVGTM
jgi:hypothetical protein